jgi:hypothetical protein
MPTLTATDDRLTPRSTLRHRPIASDTNREEPPRVRRASRTQTPQPNAKTTTPEIPAWRPATRLRSHRRQRIPMVGIGIGMVTAVLVVFLGQLVIGWMGTTWNDLHYGYPRTSQVDAVVGQGDSAAHPSHFIALNLHGQIEIIELPAGDASHAKIYLGPHLYGPDADLMPVTLQFVDSRHTRQPDMVVLFQDQQVVFRNAQGSFHAPPASP